MKLLLKPIVFFEAFFWGMIAAFGALVLELFFDLVRQISSSSPTSSTAALAATSLFVIFLNVVIEESIKFSVVAKRLRSLSHDYSLVIYSILLGLGFSFFEIWMSVFSQSKEQGILMAVMAISGNALLHVTTAGIMGLSLRENDWKRTTGGIAITVILHFLYNIAIIHINA